MDVFPAAPEDFTPGWLSQALGATVDEVKASQIAVGVGLLGRLFRLRLSGDGLPASLVAKIPTADAGARQFVAEPLRFYEKEVRVYNELASDIPLGLPRVFAAEVDPSTQDFVLLLEDLSHHRIEDQTIGCEVADACTAVDALADMHIAWWDSPRLDALGWLPAIIDPPYPEVLSGLVQLGWPAFVEVLGDKFPPPIIAFGERFPSLMEWFCDAFSQSPRTLIHGDYRLDNMFFGGQGQAPISLVDWQVTFRGRGAYDLGYFLSQSLPTDTRRAHEQSLKDRYLQRLTEAGIDYPDFETDYRRTVLYCFIYAIIATTQVEITNERQRELLFGNTDRIVAAIEDVDGLALLPS